MTDVEQMILSELADLKKLVERLNSNFSIAQITYYENLPPAAIVGVDYVAFRFSCSESAVVRGRFETSRIPRLREKPIAFIKRDVDVIWQNLNRSVPEKAAILRHKASNTFRRNKNEYTDK